MTSASAKLQLKEGGVKDSARNDSNLPVWPEWTDAFLNNVNWGSKPVKKPVSPIHRSQTHGLTEVSEDFYEDPAGLVELLPDMYVATWMRPHQIDVAVNYVVDPDPTPLDLLTYNKHLIGYKMIQTILESIMCLEREAFHRPFAVELQSTQFVATGGSQWKPWHHVYSHTSAGKGQTHRIQYNRCGKYIVRLFYLGKWRRIAVDDRLPLSEEGELLLPVSRPDNLWLPLLTKALLRVFALSRDPTFSVIHCLTGWLPTTLSCRGCDEYQLWCAFCSLMSSTEEVIQSPGGCISERSFRCPPDDTLAHLEAVCSRVIIADVVCPSTSISNLGMSSSVTNMNQLVLASNVRYNNELPNSLWKEYRWKEWAFSKGIISDNNSKSLRNIQIFNPLQVTLQVSDEICSQNVNEFWMDFDQFVPFLRVLYVYYKPSYFKYSLRAYTTLDLLSSPEIADDIMVSTRGRKTSLEKRNKKAVQSKSKSPNTDKSESVAKTNKNAKDNSKSEKNKTLKNKENQSFMIEWPKNNYSPPLFYLYLLCAMVPNSRGIVPVTVLVQRYFVKRLQIIKYNTSNYALCLEACSDIDSMTCKQLYVCLSAYDPDKPTYAHVVFGKFEWHSPSVAPIVFMLSTSSTRGHMITLSPGLHIFRVWHQLPQHFCLLVLSNTAFSTGSKFYIQHALTSDTMSYTHYGKEIINGFEQLLDAFQGSAEHGKAFGNLTNCLHPPHLTTLMTWPLWFSAHIELFQAFEESLTEMLVELSQTPEELYSTLKDFQMLFLNPVFGEETLKAIKRETYDFIKERQRSKHQQEFLKELEVKERFTEVGGKKGKEKSPKSDKKGKGNNKSPQNISERDDKATLKSTMTSKLKGGNKGKIGNEGLHLRKLLQSKEKSLILNNQNHAISIFKKMMATLPHLRKMYPFQFEDDYKLIYKDYQGEINTSDSWVVVTRCTLNLHSTKEVPCSIHVWAPLEKLVVRLINNDTQEGIPLGFVENNVAYLSKNEEGYTLCVYGTTNSASVEWRLRSLGVGEFDMLHVCQGEGCKDLSSQPPQQHQQTLNGFYVPNKDTLVTRCLLHVFSDTTILLRFYLSDPSVKCSFKLYDISGNYVLNTTGIGHIIVPIIKLEGYRKYDDVGEELQTFTTYKVEVKVLNHSWPLSKEECQALLFYKEHWPHPQLSHSPHTSAAGDPSLDSPSLSSSEPVDDAEYEFYKKVLKPSWSLTVVSDFHQVASVKLQLDMSLYISLQQFKSQWQEENMDPSSCKQLRKDFLNKSTEEEVEDWSEEVIFHLKAKKSEILTQLYGRAVSSICSPEEIYVVTHSSIKLSDTSVIGSLPISESTRTNLKPYSKAELSLLSPSEHARISQQGNTRTSFSDVSQVVSVRDVQSLSNAITEDQNDKLVQQAGLHKALESMKMKNLKHHEELMEEILMMRTQLLNDIKLAKEAKPNKGGPDAKEVKSKKSPLSERKTMTSVKESKKPKSKK